MNATQNASDSILYRRRHESATQYLINHPKASQRRCVGGWDVQGDVWSMRFPIGGGFNLYLRVTFCKGTGSVRKVTWG